MPDSEIKIYPTAQHIAEVLASEIASLAIGAKEQGKIFNIALSGGTTPKRLYNVLAEIYAEDIPWEFVHIYWSDERCVSPDHPDSNYGFTKEHLLRYVPIPQKNIHPINGGEDSKSESVRYSEEIIETVPIADKLPRFDLVILGMGSDGHTASIFDDRLDLIESDRICVSTIHPATGQKRITLTGRVINNAAFIAFMITGMEKAAVAAAILDDNEDADDYPAAYIYPENGKIIWYLDEVAASDLQ
ncbi:MAG: 6-phosphogluconolactonase [Bacteroidales bacterium]